MVTYYFIAGGSLANLQVFKSLVLQLCRSKTSIYPFIPTYL